MAAYCSQCGEKRLERDAWQLRRVAGEVAAETVELERSKLWQTLKLLLFKPGQLTRDHWAGRRQRYVGPVKLYRIIRGAGVYLTYLVASMIFTYGAAPDAVESGGEAHPGSRVTSGSGS
jgi:hypothetical protein